jgi:hypothetical protein
MKLMLALPLLALVAGCVAQGGGGIDGRQELERTIDTDLDGDGTVTEFGGFEMPADD